MKNYLPALILLFLFSCNSKKDHLAVAVAANAQYAIEEIKRIFEEEYEYPVEIIIGSSGKLTAQIREGAPYDVFISADMQYPETLFEEGLANKKPEIYAFGEVVLWSASQEFLSTEMLQTDSVQRIALANPEIAPYGEAAVEALHFYQLYDKVKEKLVFGENVAQASLYVLSGVAEAGFVPKSFVLSPQLKGKGKWTSLDAKAYMPIAQGAAVLAHSEESTYQEAIQFYNFLFSAEAKRIFRQYGYQVP